MWPIGFLRSWTHSISMISRIVVRSVNVLPGYKIAKSTHSMQLPGDPPSPTCSSFVWLWQLWSVLQSFQPDCRATLASFLSCIHCKSCHNALENTLGPGPSLQLLWCGPGMGTLPLTYTPSTAASWVLLVSCFLSEVLLNLAEKLRSSSIRQTSKGSLCWLHAPLAPSFPIVPSQLGMEAWVLTVVPCNPAWELCPLPAHSCILPACVTTSILLLKHTEHTQTQGLCNCCFLHQKSLSTVTFVAVSSLATDLSSRVTLYCPFLTYLSLSLPTPPHLHLSYFPALCYLSPRFSSFSAFIPH